MSDHVAPSHMHPFASAAPQLAQRCLSYASTPSHNNTALHTAVTKVRLLRHKCLPLTIQDYDFVTIEFSASHRPCLPSSIRLRPIIWESSTSLPEPSSLANRSKSSYISSYTSPEKKSAPQLMNRLLMTMSPATTTSANSINASDYSINQVLDGFVRFVQQSSHKDHPYLLSHHSILSLQMPILSKMGISGENPAIEMIDRDFLVEFSDDSQTSKGNSLKNR